LKELGEYLKSVREENGVGIDEVADDLKISKQILLNIESGNTRSFRDVLELKSIVKSYAKYLGLDSEKIVDEFNDFLFEHTSKINLNDILEAEKQINSKEQKKICSPYTRLRGRQLDAKYLRYIFIFILTIVLILFALIILKSVLFPKDVIDSELLNDCTIEGVFYEYS